MAAVQVGPDQGLQHARIRDIDFPEAITGGRFYMYNKDDETLEVVA